MFGYNVVTSRLFSNRSFRVTEILLEIVALTKLSIIHHTYIITRLCRLNSMNRRDTDTLLLSGGVIKRKTGRSCKRGDFKVDVNRFEITPRTSGTRE